MADGPSPDVGFSHLGDLDRGLHSGIDANTFQSMLQGQGVDNGGQHTHIITGHPFHP